jgi:hypothetical protein
MFLLDWEIIKILSRAGYLMSAIVVALEFKP